MVQSAIRILRALVPVCLLLGAVQTASGGTARVLGLGDAAAFLNDPANVHRWYASLVDHPDLLVLELGDVVYDQDDALATRSLLGHGGGVHLRLGEHAAWGTAAVFFEDHLARAVTDGAFSILWGRGLGRWNLGLGGRFTTFGRSQAGTELGDRIDSEYLHEYRLGLARRLSARARIEFAGELINSIYESSGALFQLSEKEWTTFGLRIRAELAIAPEATLVPLLTHARVDRSLENQEIGGPADRDAHRTGFGLGVRLRRDEQTLVVVSGEYRAGRDDLRQHDDDPVDPLWERRDREFYQLRGRVGAEHALRPWLTIRAAAQYVRMHEQIDRERSDAHSDDPARESLEGETVAVALCLGLSVQYGQVGADFAFNDTAPINAGLQGPGLFSGEGPGFAALTLHWRF